MAKATTGMTKAALGPAARKEKTSTSKATKPVAKGQSGDHKGAKGVRASSAAEISWACTSTPPTAPPWGVGTASPPPKAVEPTKTQAPLSMLGGTLPCDTSTAETEANPSRGI